MPIARCCGLKAAGLNKFEPYIRAVSAMQACWLFFRYFHLFDIVIRRGCCAGALLTAIWGAHAQTAPLLDFRFFTVPLKGLSESGRLAW